MATERRNSIPIENLGSLWEPPTYGIRHRKSSDWVTCGRCGTFVSDSVTHSEWHAMIEDPMVN